MKQLTLIDTSSWIEALRTQGNAQVRQRVKSLMLEEGAAWCEMILLELWNGARGNYEQKMLKELEREIICLPTNQEVWSLSKELAKKCRKAGKTVPSTDLLIVACGLKHNVPIEHQDKHLDVIIQDTDRSPG